MTRTVTASVPLDVTFSGTADSDTLTRMERQVASAVHDQLAALKRALIDHSFDRVPRAVAAPDVTVTGPASQADRNAISAALSRAINAAIAESGIGTVDRPLALRGGRAPRRYQTRPGPPVRIASTGEGTITIGQFIEYFDEFGSGGTDTIDILRALYGDRADDIIPFKTTRIDVNQPLLLDIIGAHYGNQAVLASPPDTVAFWVYTTQNNAPAGLSTRSATDDSDITALTHPSGSTFTLPDGSIGVLPGTQVFFVHAYLPHIELSDLISLSVQDSIAVPVQTRDLAFLADQSSFERLLGVPWAEYADTFGNDPAQLHMIPFQALRRTHYDAVHFLMHARVAATISADTAYFAQTRILSNTALSQLPAPARAVAAGYTDAQSRLVTDQFGVFEENWRGAFIYATFNLSEDQRVTALFRTQALAIADDLADLIRNASRRDITWTVAMLNVFSRSFGSSRSDDQIGLFDLVLDELDRRGLLEGLFRAVENAQFYAIHAALVRFTTAGRYANHPLAVSTRALLNQRAADMSDHSYDVANNRMLVNRTHPQPAGGWVGDVDDRYIHEVEGYELSPASLRRFKTAALQEADTLAEEIISGRNTGDFTHELFVREAMRRAAEALNLGEDDYIEVVKQTTARFISVEQVTEGGIERTYVTWALATRNRGGTWREVEGSRRRQLAGYFHETLAFWRIARGLEGLRTLALIVGVGTVAIVGIVFLPELIALGGGLKVIIGSIVISELFYLATLVFTDAEFSWEGVALAALDGYLMAVGFRLGSLAAAGLTGRIFSTSAISTVGKARLAVLMTRGGVGGGATGALIRFSHDLYEFGTGQRDSFSSLGEYALHIGIGTVLGMVGDVAVNAAMTRVMATFSAARQAGSESAITLAEVADRLSAEGVTLNRFAAESIVISDVLRQRFSAFLDDAAAGQLQRHFTDTLAQIRAHYPNALASQRLIQALEMVNLRLGRTGVTGLERFIAVSGTELDDATALALVRSLRGVEGVRTQQFFNAFGTLDDVAIRRLLRHNQLEALLTSDRALALALDPSDLFSHLLRNRFGNQINRLDEFLATLEALTTDATLRIRIMRVLVDQPTLTNTAVISTVERLGLLNTDGVNGLLALFRTSRRPAELNALIARANATTLPRLLAMARSLGPTNMTAVLERDVALQFARSAQATRLLEVSGWTQTAQVLEDRFASSVAPLREFANLLGATGADDAAVRNVMNALAQNGSYSNESLLVVAGQLGDVSPANATALGQLFDLSTAGLPAAAVDDMILRQATHSTGALNGLLSLPTVLANDLNELALRGALEPLAQNATVLSGIAGRRVRSAHFMPLVRPRADGHIPNVPRVIEALERLLVTQPNVPLRRIGQNLVNASRLPLTLADRAAGTQRLMSTAETIEILGDIATTARLGVDQFSTGTGLGSGTVEAVESATRLIGDNIHPRVARTSIDVTTAGVNDIAAPATAVSIEFTPAAAGGLRPDLSLTFVDIAGAPVGLVGRESVAISPGNIVPGLTPAQLRNRALNNLRARVTEKAVGVPTNEVALRATPTTPVLAQEIEVLTNHPQVSAILDDTLITDMVAAMRRFGDDAMFLHVDRVRFYDFDGRIRVIWSNPARGGAGVVSVGTAP